MQKIRQSPWLPFALFALGVFAFYLLCTRLFVKMDDGHFLGFLHSPGFELVPWLQQRYVTNSGRTIGEALMMTFLRAPLWVWQLLSAAALSVTAWFMCRVCAAGQGAVPGKRRVSFACALVLLVLPTGMSAGAFWFAGSFTFLWPMAALVLCVTPHVFALLGITQQRWVYAVSFAAAPVAASSEQAAAAVIAALVCLNIFMAIRKQWHVWAALPVIPAGAATWFLFNAPGAALRSAAEARRSFPAFLDMGLLGRFLAGFSNYLAYALFLSIPVMTIFLLLLYHNLRGHKRLVKAHGICWAALCVGGNLATLLLRRQNPDMFFEAAHAHAQFDWYSAALLAVSALFFISILWLIVLLIKQNRALGLGVGLCVAAAVGCGIAPGFSGSLYASGQRIFFFSEIFLLIAAALLYGSAQPVKYTQAVHKIAVALAGAFALFQLLGFQLLEIPFMG